MKGFLIFLAIGLTASEKLGLGYLPPPGAQFSGGSPDDIQIPLEPPNFASSSLQTIPIGQEAYSESGIYRIPQNYGPGTIGTVQYNPEKVPTTTTTYAFTQTTTYPESYETTALPINPVTGLPVQNLGQAYQPTQEQIKDQKLPIYEQNLVQGGLPFGFNLKQDIPQEVGNQLSNIIPNYVQAEHQPLNQYADINQINSGTLDSLRPISDQGLVKNFGGLIQPGSQSYEHPSQKLANLGSVIGNVDGPLNQEPGFNLESARYPNGQTFIGQQGQAPTAFTPHTTPTSFQPANQYGVNYDKGFPPVSPPNDSNSGRPIQVQGIGSSSPTSSSYDIQDQINKDNVQQYPGVNRALPASGPSTGGPIMQTHEPEISSGYNTVSSSTPLPSIPSSTFVYSTNGPINRPERPQAASDRNAIILNYENIRTPYGYSYNFDTSNGIHADENGIVDNGTKAQGAYSYIGDDGKVYSVTYTADENGFQPRGDHLPTPPPIPEAIQKVIEQAARDRAAGIVDDGSYDEAKYGHKNYYDYINHGKPGNDKNGNRKPVARIYDDEYNENLPLNYKDNSDEISDIRNPTDKNTSNQPSNIIFDNGGLQNVKSNLISSGKNEKKQFGDIHENNKPYKELEKIKNNDGFYTNNQQYPIQGNKEINGLQNINQLKNSETYNGYVGGSPGSTINKSFAENNNNDINPSNVNRNNNQNKHTDFSQSNGPSSGKHVEESLLDYPSVSTETYSEQLSGNHIPIRNKYGERIRQPQTEKSYNRNNGGQLDSANTNVQLRPDLPGNGFNLPASNQQVTQQDDTGYYYQTPNNKLDENKFSNRFRPQNPSSIRNMENKEIKSTTRRPFITPNIYDENDSNRYKENDKMRGSSTRRPFITPGISIPIENDYKDYDDNNDFGAKIKATMIPNQKYHILSHPQSIQTTSRPQSTASEQKIHNTQKDTAFPDQNILNSGSATPGYVFGSTTPMPSYDSRFGSTESSRKRTQSKQRRPSGTTTIPGLSTTIGNPAYSRRPQNSYISDYRYKTTEPSTESYEARGSNMYSPSSISPGLSSSYLSPGGSTSQNYPTTRPDYTTTAVTPTSEYNTKINSPVSSGISGTAPISFVSYQTPYPPTRIDYSTTTSPVTQGSEAIFTTPKASGISQPPSTNSHKTIFKQGPGDYGSTGYPNNSGRYQQGNYAQPSTATYQKKYQSGPSTSSFPITTAPTIQAINRDFGSTMSPLSQNKYGLTQPAYSSTVFPSTIATGPSFTTTGQPVTPNLGYSTQQPGIFSTKSSAFDTLVDGFGRPINSLAPSTQRPSYQETVSADLNNPTYGNTNSANLSSNRNLGGVQPNYTDFEASTAYPVTYVQPKVIGEDFSGPKQSQRFDPETGYHYK